MHSDTLCWLRWVLVPNLGLKRSQTLLNLIDSPASLFLHPDRLPLPERIKFTIREMNLMGEQHPIHRRALEQLEWAESTDNHLITLANEHYPNALHQIDDSPLVLWAKGNLKALDKTQIAIVGSRDASPNALRHTKDISCQLAVQSLAITSGGAKGIDTACHQAVIEQKGSTIAVFGCGIDVVYPKTNRSLFQAITKQGLLLSEYPLGTQPRPGHFPRRNRLISALSAVVIIIEASVDSGTLITARHALEQGKDIFALPGDINNPNTHGCHKLIQEGAYLLSSAQDILEHLQWQHQTIHSRSQLDTSHLNLLQQQIIEQLKYGITPIDGLSHQLSVAAHQLLEPVLELELAGYIEQHPGGYILCHIA